VSAGTRDLLRPPETPDVQPLVCLAGPRYLRRFVAHLLIRLLILGGLPAHIQVRALLFPAWPLGVWLPDFGAAEQSASVGAPLLVAKDQNGNRQTQVEENGGPAQTTSYGYDGLNRLTSVTLGPSVTEYGYDLVGNRKTEKVTDNGTTIRQLTSLFDEANRLTTLTDELDAAKSWAFTWRGGELWKKVQGAGTPEPTEWEYRYDATSMLVEAIRTQTTIVGGVPQTNTITAMRAGYDQAGRRTLKHGNDGTLQYVYAGSNLVSEYNLSGTQLASYAWGGGSIISTYRPGRTDYFTFDSLGSATTLTDATGGIAARYGLDPWGVVKDPTQLTLHPNRVTYTGHYFDPEVGLYYARARYLSPELGVFTTQDTYLGQVVDPRSLHRLSYAYGSPTKYVDPSGNLPILIPILLVALMAVNTGTGYYEAESRRLERGLTEEQAGGSLSLGFSDATGMTGVFRAFTGGDPYTAKQLGAGGRIWEGTIGALGLAGTGAVGGQLLKAGASVAGASSSAFQAARGGLQGAASAGRAAVGRLGSLAAAEWSGTLGQVASDARAVGSALRHPLQTARAAGEAVREGLSSAKASLQSLRDRAVSFVDDVKATIDEGIASHAAKSDEAIARAIVNGQRSQIGAVGRQMTDEEARAIVAAADDAGAAGPSSGGSGPYDPRAIRAELEAAYPGRVSSSTVPPSGAKNVGLAGTRHPAGIVFDQRGFPIFDDIAAFETRLGRQLSSVADPAAHMRASTRALREAIARGEADVSRFSGQQLAAIQRGSRNIPGYTWHHHQDLGRMQLIPTPVHRQVGHVGGMEMWFQP
jgi:RHS repeat-associated protein